MSTQSMVQTQVMDIDGAAYVRNVLKVNALFSSLSGVAFLVAAKPIANFLGIGGPAVITVAGILLLIFAGDVLFVATRKVVNLKFVMAIIAADGLWVLGSVILLLTNLVPFTVEGKWAIAILAVIVAIFAELEYIGLRKMEKSK